MQNFKAVEHRLEYVATIRGVEYYNDSKATNVDATIKALESFPANIHLILGGKDKDSDYTRPQRSFAATGEAGLYNRRCGGENRVTDSRDRGNRSMPETLETASSVPRRLPKRETLSCWLPPVPASINSRIMNTADECSRKW